MRHHHHATVKEVVVFHDDDGNPNYLFQEWKQKTEEPCECGLIDPFQTDEDVTT